MPMLGLPDAIRACLFDLDGVLTQTAKVHAAAWKQMFDTFLRTRAARSGEAFVPFDPAHDYDRYVDGLPRYDGVRSFLASRGIELPDGTPGDPPGAETIRGLGALRARGSRRGPALRGCLLERELPRRVGGCRDRRALRRARGRHRARARASARQARAGHVSLRCARARRRPEAGGGLRGRAGRRRRGARRRIRLRGRRRPGRPGRGAARARRRHRRRRSRRVARPPMITHPAFAVEPWSVRETELDLAVLAQTESVFALANGHIGLRGNLDEGEPFGLPGTYLNSFYELR